MVMKGWIPDPGNYWTWIGTIGSFLLAVGFLHSPNPVFNLIGVVAGICGVVFLLHDSVLPHTDMKGDKKSIV